MTTKDDVQQNINSRLTTKATLIEGGTVQDIVGSVSYELANILDTKINIILDNAFVTTADEEHLLIKGNELGINKKEATYSRVVAQISNADNNILISTDVQAKTDTDLIFQVENAATTDENGCASVSMVCLTPGESGNIQAGELKSFCLAYEGLENADITNDVAGYDGYNEEDIEDYRERILEYMREDACNSNIADYILWAKSVNGVKSVVVKDATVAGAGKVNVYISAQNDAVVSQELINNVKNYIKEKQIINADVRVYALEYVLINISASVILKSGATIEDVTDKFNKILENYLAKVSSTVSYLYISNLFFEIEDIADVSNYLLNNASQSVQITDLQIPVKGNVTFSVEEE